MKKCLIAVLAFVLMGLALVDTAGAARLESIFVVTRHGSRTPFGEVFKTPYEWEVPPGQLTALGMQQEYKLGQRLKKRYIVELELLPATYKDETIHAVANHPSRCIVSAQCLLMGMYPPGTGPETVYGENALPHRFQPVPIYSLPNDSTMLLPPYQDYLILLDKYVYPSKDWKKMSKKYEKYYYKWSKFTRLPIRTLANALDVGNTLSSIITQNMPLPKGMSQDDAETLIKTMKEGFALHFKNMNISFIVGHQLVNDILNKIEDMTSGKSGCKMYLYSAHDLTILALMALLGSPLDTLPGYASSAIIELYSDKSGAYVKVFYDGKYMDLAMMSSNKEVSAKKFKNQIKKTLYKYRHLLSE